ncbi:hypothetical protein BDZ91DRAFT_717015 [Kalaharituber pfeilii]|nr:hypothetical protein BDZ91DRAFT_717015 [Kalaharituber pfeilii]
MYIHSAALQPFPQLTPLPRLHSAHSPVGVLPTRLDEVPPVVHLYPHTACGRSVTCYCAAARL